MSGHAEPCRCDAPDWYHDGVASECLGRLCRACRRREGNHGPWHTR